MVKSRTATSPVRLYSGPNAVRSCPVPRAAARSRLRGKSGPSGASGTSSITSSATSSALAQRGSNRIVTWPDRAEPTGDAAWLPTEARAATATLPSMVSQFPEMPRCAVTSAMCTGSIPAPVISRPPPTARKRASPAGLISAAERSNRPRTRYGPRRTSSSEDAAVTRTASRRPGVGATVRSWKRTSLPGPSSTVISPPATARRSRTRGRLDEPGRFVAPVGGEDRSGEATGSETLCRTWREVKRSRTLLAMARKSLPPEVTRRRGSVIRIAATAATAEEPASKRCGAIATSISVTEMASPTRTSRKVSAPSALTSSPATATRAPVARDRAGFEICRRCGGRDTARPGPERSAQTRRRPSVLWPAGVSYLSH